MRNIFKKSSKKLSQKQIIRRHFIKLFLIVFLLSSFFRWMHYRDFTDMKVKEKHVRVSYDKIENPDPKKEYFMKYEITKITKSKGFMIVVTSRDKKYIHTYGKEKCSSCNN